MTSQSGAIWPDGVNAVSTIVVAVFAVIQVVKLFLDDRTRRSEIEARLSAAAFALRRQLQEWLVVLPTAEYTVFNRATDIQAFVRRAEDRVTGMVEHAAGASRHVRRAVSEAYVRFYQGMSRINAELELEFQYGAGEEQGLLDGFDHIRQACTALEHVIGPDLKRLDQGHSEMASDGLPPRKPASPRDLPDANAAL